MLECHRHLFDIEDGIHYLNCAYQAPLMHEVVESGHRAMISRQRPYKDAPEDFFQPQENLKILYTQLTGASDHERVAIIPSVSYGIANIASNVELREGDNIVVSDAQFPSNVYPWRERCEQAGAELRFINRPPDDIPWTIALIEGIDERTRAVALGNVHWTDGTKFDLPAIAKRARKFDALIIIDATQSLGALPFDFDAVKPDALICAGYKWLLGPYSLGLGYYGPKFDGKTPIENNWITRKDSHKFQQLVSYQDEYRPKAYRFTVGEPSNFILLPMLTSSLKRILEWRPDRIQEYARNLSGPFIPRWRDMGYIIPTDEQRSSHLFGIKIPGGLTSSQIQLLLKKHNVHVSFRGDSLRVSLHLWNTDEDMHALTRALEEIRQLV